MLAQSDSFKRRAMYHIADIKTTEMEFLIQKSSTESSFPYLALDIGRVLDCGIIIRDFLADIFMINKDRRIEEKETFFFITFYSPLTSCTSGLLNQ
jgi:hypothetical protein